MSISIIAVTVGLFATSSSVHAQQEPARRPQRQSFGDAVGPIQPPLTFDEQAKTILAKSAARYKALKTWHVEASVVSAGRYTKKFVADFRAPQNLVVTTNEAKGINTVANYAAGKVTHLREFDNLIEYQETSLTQDGEQNTRLALNNALGQYLSGFFLGEENVFGRQPIQTVKYAGTSTVNGVLVDNIEVTSVRRDQLTTSIYSIGKQDSLLHKVVATTVNDEGNPSDYVETYSNQKVDAQIPDSAFKLNLPAGAQKVERFTSSRGLQVNVGEKPFAIQTKDIKGKELSLEQYKGKVVLLDFWATWCAPCRAELPNVKAAYAKYKDQGFDVLGISFDQTIDPLQPFITKESLGWRHVYDGYWHGPIAQAYNVRFIPSTVLIGRDGKVVAINARGAALEPAIEAALKSPSTGPTVAKLP